MLFGGVYLIWGMVAKEKLTSPSRAQSCLANATPISGRENGWQDGGWGREFE